MKIKAEIVADSLSPQGNRLISVLCTFPRMILAEVNTHRMLSGNTSSSRAIPFEKMVKAVEEDPFIPIAWQKEHKGMQGSEYFSEVDEGKIGTEYDDIYHARKEWLNTRDNVIIQAKQLNKQGVTKQLCNRLLEPFMWTTKLITGSKEGWDNFFSLRNPVYELKAGTTISNSKNLYFKSYKDLLQYIRNNSNNQSLIQEFENKSILEKLQINKGHAEIHMMALAEAIYDAMNESTPKKLKEGEWHIPFQDTFDLKLVAEIAKKLKIPVLSWEDGERVKAWISTAMAARTSYTVIGEEKEVDYQKLIELHDRLIAQNPPHSSPMEHCARAMNDEEYYSWIKGKVPTYVDDYGIYNIEYYPICYKESINFGGPLGENPNNGDKFGWCRNFKGFIPYRYLIENE